MHPDPERELKADWIRLEASLRERGIGAAALAALAQVPRETFLPPQSRHHAYEDRALAIGHDQTCSQPWILAEILQALDLAAGAQVLEVGAGSGYLAALLRAAGAGRVDALELLPELACGARRNLNRAGVDGVVVWVADGRKGLPGRAPFDAVVVSAAATRIPPALMEQVGPRGRLICPVIGPVEERLWCLQRAGDGWRDLDLGACRFVPLR
jgi:protein-L-isoaspartate(D-aspartate) O-methyltransferase